MSIKENSFRFYNDGITKAYLKFTAYDDEERNQEIAIEIMCNEDILYTLDLYKKEKWHDLVEGKVWEISENEVRHVEFNGIEFRADDGNGNKIFAYLYENTLYSSAYFNKDDMEARNAKKLEQIKEILNS